MAPRTRDQRPELRIAEATWAREGEVGKKLLLHEATRMGVRLVIVTGGGEEWLPWEELEEWNDD